MWIITVFEHQNVRIFEYTTKDEATQALQHFSNYAVLSYTE